MPMKETTIKELIFHGLDRIAAAYETEDKFTRETSLNVAIDTLDEVIDRLNKENNPAYVKKEEAEKPERSEDKIKEFFLNVAEVGDVIEVDAGIKGETPSTKLVIKDKHKNIAGFDHRIIMEPAEDATKMRETKDGWETALFTGCGHDEESVTDWELVSFPINKETDSVDPNEFLSLGWIKSVKTVSNESDEEKHDLIIENNDVLSSDKNMYRINGFETPKSGSQFNIYLNKDFGKLLQFTENQEKQEAMKNALSTPLKNKGVHLEFDRDTLLLTNITIGGEAGIDINQEEWRDSIEYTTHNVNTAEQAAEIISIFSTWVDLAHTAICSEYQKQPN